jgi:hypothetical protein
VSASTLSWSLNVTGDEPNAATNATEDTIDHYEVFDSGDGENLTLLATLPRGTRSVNLQDFDLGPGPRTLYVKAVGRPSILSKLSNAVAYNRYVTITSPADGATVASPVRVTATATSPDTVTRMEIWIDRTNKVFQQTDTNTIDTTIPLASGPHRLTVQAIDSSGAVFKRPINITGQ